MVDVGTILKKTDVNTILLISSLIFQFTQGKLSKHIVP